MKSSASRVQFSFTFTSAGPGDAVSFNVPVYADATTGVQEKNLTLDGSSAVSVWAAPQSVTAIAKTGSGQLEAVEATVDNPTVAEVPSGGGGGGGGASEQSVKITKFAFDHSTASLKNGVVAYTPAVGEILLDLWVEVTEAWNGTTPKCDVGFFLTSGSGLFAAAQGGALIDLAVADAQDGANDSNAPWTGPLLAQSDAAATPSSLAQSWAGLFTPGFPPNRGLPAKFTDVTPLKVCVSTNGNSSGGSPTGSTAGSAVVYFATAIPA